MPADSVPAGAAAGGCAGGGSQQQQAHAAVRQRAAGNRVEGSAGLATGTAAFAIQN